MSALRGRPPSQPLLREARALVAVRCASLTAATPMISTFVLFDRRSVPRDPVPPTGYLVCLLARGQHGSNRWASFRVGFGAAQSGSADMPALTAAIFVFKDESDRRQSFNTTRRNSPRPVVAVPAGRREREIVRRLMGIFPRSPQVAVSPWCDASCSQKTDAGACADREE